MTHKQHFILIMIPLVLAFTKEVSAQMASEIFCKENVDVISSVSSDIYACDSELVAQKLIPSINAWLSAQRSNAEYNSYRIEVTRDFIIKIGECSSQYAVKLESIANHTDPSEREVQQQIDMIIGRSPNGAGGPGLFGFVQVLRTISNAVDIGVTPDTLGGTDNEELKIYGNRCCDQGLTSM